MFIDFVQNECDHVNWVGTLIIKDRVHNCARLEIRH
jgi:hypothetical protein